MKEEEFRAAIINEFTQYCRRAVNSSQKHILFSDWIIDRLYEKEKENNNLSLGNQKLHDKIDRMSDDYQFLCDRYDKLLERIRNITKRNISFESRIVDLQKKMQDLEQENESRKKKNQMEVAYFGGITYTVDLALYSRSKK